MKRVAPILLLPLVGCRAQETPPTPVAPPSTTSTTTMASATAAPAPSASAAPAATATGPARSWTFDEDTPGSPPSGFAFGRTGGGHEGTWVVRAEAGAPSGANVLAQTDADSADCRFPVAFASEPLLADVDLGVRCKPVSGSVDQACGLVFRLKDTSNYYVTRANALENNVRLYFVKDGRRQQIASWSGKVTSGAWHTYRVVARGDRVEVFWDGVRVLDQHDATFSAPGHVGLWTKADSVTYFDDLTVRPAG